MRNPRRTSSTAAALMIGLTLVVSMGVFASSLKASFGDVIADQTNADLYVATLERPGPGFSPSVIDAVAGRRRAWTRSRPTAGARRASTAPDVELLGRRPGHRRGGHEPRRLAGFARRPRQGRRRGVEGRRDGQRLEARRHGHGGVRRDRQAPAARRRRSTTARAGSATTSCSASTSRTPSPARSSSPRRWSPSPPAPTRARSRTPSRRPWPTTRTPRCWTRRASRRRPAGSSTSCSPS